MAVQNDHFYISYLSSQVHKYLQEDDLASLKYMMNSVIKDKETVNKVISYNEVSNPPLFAACWQGKVKFVEYFLDECGADIEQMGIFEVEEDQSKHKVSPLWCAAVSNKLDVVQALTQRNADVNSASDTGSTPVRSACYMTNIDCIKYLVEHGADIHISNINGGTCLINSVQSVELCKYLIEKGANVNDKDSSGNLALHYAVREGRLETVKLLLDYKSDLDAINDFGDDALQTAALRCQSDIMLYILKFNKDPVKKIHAYELLGTSLIDDKHDITAGINMWKLAMVFRFADPQNPILKKTLSSPNPAYGKEVEPSNMSELETLSHDPDAIYMQCLLIRERILGATHKDTTFGLMYRGAVYADSQNYQRCVDLWKYALQLRGCKDIHSHESLLTLQALGKLFWEMDSEMSFNATCAPIIFKDALEVFDILVNYIRTSEPFDSNVACKRIYLAQEQESLVLLKLALQMINLLQKLNGTPDEKNEFFKLVRALVQLDFRDTNKKTLLHLAMNKTSSIICGEQYSTLPSLEIVKVLVRCGANMEAVDSKNNTVLMDSVRNCDVHSDKGKEILYYLLDMGAHIDTRDSTGSTPLDELHQNMFPIYSLSYINLKCLASRVIMKKKINYEGHVPRSLVQYIQKH